MDDLDKYIEKRKNANPDFGEQFDELIRQAHEQAKQAGLTKKDITAAIKQARGNNKRHTDNG